MWSVGVHADEGSFCLRIRGSSPSPGSQGGQRVPESRLEGLSRSHSSPVGSPPLPSPPSPPGTRREMTPLRRCQSLPEWGMSSRLGLEGKSGCSYSGRGTEQGCRRVGVHVAEVRVRRMDGTARARAPGALQPWSPSEEHGPGGKARLGTPRTVAGMDLFRGLAALEMTGGMAEGLRDLLGFGSRRC